MSISSKATGLRPGVCTSTTRPTSPYTGMIIYETDTGQMLVWSGSSWGSLNPTSNRNMVINGSVVVDQRNNGAAISSAGYVADRWYTATNSSGAWTFQRLSPTSGTTSSPLPPPGFRSYIKYTKTTGVTPPSTGQTNYFLQYVEGFNSAQLGWGATGAKSATLSFWVYSGATGTFGGSARNAPSTYWSFPFTYTVNAANTWEYKTVQIPPVTSGTWNTDNQIGISLFFDLGTTADYRGTAGSWSNNNYVGASGTSQYPTTTSGGYVCWTGFQLEVGTQASGFENRSYSDELMLCQRYYYKSTHNPSTQVGVGMIYSTNNAITVNRFPVPMRIAPTTAVITGLTAGIDSGGTGRGFGASAFNQSTTEDVSLVHTGGFNFTNGAACYVYTQAGGWNYAVSAEL